jgi:arabinofuranan 3-O-arabinosyltransferase
VAATYEPTVWARPRPGPELDDLLDRANALATPLGLLPTVTASSNGVPDPAARPGSVLDGDPATAWQAAIGDQNPWLRLNWLIPQNIAGLRFAIDEGVAGTRPAAVTVIGNDGLRSGDVDEDGVVTFDQPLLTDQITIVFLDRPPARSFDPYANRWDALPVAVGELTALPFTENKAPDLDAPASLPCGSGPELNVNGVRVATTLTATLRELLERREVPATPCPDAPQLSLSAGDTRVVASASSLADPTRVALTPATPPTAAAATPVAIGQWGPVERHVTVQAHPADRILAVRENTNPGWRATVAGRELAPIVVDGWQQGWLLPAGVAGDVTLTFAPDVPYRASLIGGAAALAIVVLLAAIPVRRRAGHAAALDVTHGAASAWRVPAAIGCLAMILVGGLTAVLAMTVGVCAILLWRAFGSGTPVEERRWRRYWRAAWYWLPVAAICVAGWLAPTGLDNRSTAGPQIAVLVAGTALWLSLLISSRWRGRRAPQR